MIRPSRMRKKNQVRVELIGPPGALSDAFNGFLARHATSIADIFNSFSQSGSAGDMFATADHRDPAVFTDDGIDQLQRGAGDAMRNDGTPFQQTDMGRQTGSVRGEYASNPAGNDVRASLVS
jgi:hypothetical protein